MGFNVLEIKAAPRGLQVACMNVVGVGLRIKTENASTAAYTNKSGTKENSALKQLKDHRIRQKR